MSEGKFVVFEGADGVGKTVQAKRLAETLRKAGGDVVETREPTDHYHAGRLIREILSRGDAGLLGWRAMALLFSSDRAEHVGGLIEPALREGKTVICDRYYLSTAIYQTARFYMEHKRLKDPDQSMAAYDAFRAVGAWIMEVNSWCPTPDLTLVLHSAWSDQRLSARGGNNAYDRDPELQACVAELYRHPERWIGGERVVHVNADGNEDEVAARVLRAFLEESR
jgi:dTMP kinase